MIKAVAKPVNISLRRHWCHPSRTGDRLHPPRAHDPRRKSLEAEVLALFDRQADMLLARMEQAAPAAAAAFAHTIKGSARGIGAWRVAEAAEAVERAAASPAGILTDAIDRLAGAIDEAQVKIAERCGASTPDRART